MINPVKLFLTPCVEVEWDSIVQRSLKPAYQTQTHARIPIRLFDLLKGLGSVQPRRVNSSWLSTLMDYGYLLERIYDAPDLKLKITETREKLGSEMLTEVSELMGVGLSVAVVSQIYDVQQSTIHKIIRNSRRPDWECLLGDNRVLIVEAKGSTSSSTSNSQLVGAIAQKQAEQGDEKIATASLLEESTASGMRIVDPPIIGGEDGRISRHAHRAFHYTSLFSFLGDDILSLYFEKMAKRLSGTIGEEEMQDKELMFNELVHNIPIIKVNNECYAGHLYGPVEDRYVFLGVDKRLLSYQGFIDYQDAIEDRQINIDGNLFISQRDGVLVANINNADVFFRENQIKSIGVSEENIALAALDSIRSSSFKRYVRYLLRKCDENTRWNEDGSLTAKVNGQSKDYYIYHVRNLKSANATKRRLQMMIEHMRGRQGILVTNLHVRRGGFNFPCVDRDGFVRIADSMGDKEVIKKEFAI